MHSPAGRQWGVWRWSLGIRQSKKLWIQTETNIYINTTTCHKSNCQTMIVISTYLLSQSLYLILNLCILSTLQIHQFMLVYKTLPHMQGHNIIQFVIVWIVRTVFYTVIYTVQMTCDTYSECHHLSQSCLDVFTPMLILLTSKFLVNIWLSFSLCRHLTSLLQVQSKCNYPSDFPVHKVVKM